MFKAKTEIEFNNQQTMRIDESPVTLVERINSAHRTNQTMINVHQGINTVWINIDHVKCCKKVGDKQ